MIALALLCLHTHSDASGNDPIFKGVKNVNLRNGMTVLIKENHSQPLVSVQVWVKVGSINENESTAGLSHFIEHLIFKGSRKYPGDAITRKVETRRGMINAATSKEFTEFYIDIQKEGFEESVRMLADAMSSALFPAEEIERERPVVIEEIVRSNDNPNSVLYDLYNSAVFQKTPYRHNVIGSEQVIRKVSRDNIVKYYSEHYVPENIIVSVAGDLNSDKALALIKDTFGKQAGPKPPQQPVLIEPSHGPNSQARTKDLEHAYWLGGFIGPDIASDDQFTADLASTILGGGRSSRLFRKLREEKRLVYYINASFWSQHGSGSFALMSVYDPKKEKDVVDGINAELNSLMNDGPTDEEVARAKVMAKSQWFFGMETFHDQASTLAYWNLMERPELADGYIAGLEKVTKEDIKDFFNKYYRPYGLNQAILIPKVKNAK